MVITITSNQAAHRRNGGPPVIQISSTIPSAAAKIVMDRVISALRRAGYIVHDLRISEVAACKKCGIRPPATPRARYCRECFDQIFEQHKRKYRRNL